MNTNCKVRTLELIFVQLISSHCPKQKPIFTVVSTTTTHRKLFERLQQSIIKVRSHEYQSVSKSFSRLFSSKILWRFSDVFFCIFIQITDFSIILFIESLLGSFSDDLLLWKLDPEQGGQVRQGPGVLLDWIASFTQVCRVAKKLQSS